MGKSAPPGGGVVLSVMAMLRQSRLVILLKSTDFGLAIRDADPDVGKVLLNEVRECDDGIFFGRTERCDTLNFVFSKLNLSLESGDSSRNVHAGESESANVDECNGDVTPITDRFVQVYPRCLPMTLPGARCYTAMLLASGCRAPNILSRK